MDGIRAFIDMVDMVIGNRLFNTVFIFCFVHIFLGQEVIDCEKTVVNFNDKLFMVLDNYIDRSNKKDVTILIDYMTNDSVDIFRLNGSLDGLELVYKKPDCFLYYRNNLIYLYTENYYTKKDTIWLNTVLFETMKFYRDLEIKINWENDSISKFSFSLYCEYDPSIIEYKIYNGEIIEQKFCTEMLYPKTGKPKGILLIEDMIKDTIIRKKPEYQKEYYYKRNYGGGYYGY